MPSLARAGTAELFQFKDKVSYPHWHLIPAGKQALGVYLMACCSLWKLTQVWLTDMKQSNFTCLCIKGQKGERA